MFINHLFIIQVICQLEKRPVTQYIAGETHPPWSASLPKFYNVLFLLCVALTLFFNHFLLFGCKGCKTRAESRRLLLRIVLVALISCFQLSQKLGIICAPTQIPHGNSAAKQGDKVVEVQARAVLIEHEEEHHGHQEHHVLHNFHLLGLLSSCSHRISLLAHSHDAIKYVGKAEQDAEKGKVIAKSPNVCRPTDEVIVS